MTSTTFLLWNSLAFFTCKEIIVQFTLLINSGMKLYQLI